MLVAYTGAIHHGVGPAATAAPGRWYEPSAFLTRIDFLDFAFESPGRLFGCFVGPALALAVGVFGCCRSAIARALSLTCVAAIPLFLFYGQMVPDIWRLFGWRGSAVMGLTAACAGFAVAAPLLAASWLRLAWPLRAVCYLPVAFGVIAFIRNATGTDENLRYALSPWPAVPVFGLELAALFAVAALAGIGLATAGFARAAVHARPAAAGIRLAAVAVGLGIPVGIVAGGAALGLFPFRVGAATLLGVASVCAACIAGVAAWRCAGNAGEPARRARHIALGAALAGAPLLVGQLWARFDYQLTREYQARSIIAALDRFEARETLFPDSLDELVRAGDLAEIPTPAIGFVALSHAEFRYQSFGSSFLLEFEAPRWVECAYTPPYADEGSGDDSKSESLDESWSCPSEPPELW